MKKAGLNILKFITVSIISIILLNSTVTVAKAETKNDETVTLTGYLIDEHCFEHKSDNPGTDTKMCLLMEACIKGGYGIAVPQTDGSYKFYYFDGNFFTDTANLDGTAGQKVAYDLIVASTKKDHLLVTVTGALEGITKSSINLKEVSYPVVDVVNLAEATEEEAANFSQIANNTNVQNGKMEEEHKTGDHMKMEGDHKTGDFISIKYIGIGVAVLVVLGVAVILILKRIKKSK